MKNIVKEVRKRTKRKIKSGDSVIVIAGNHKGKVGTVLRRRLEGVTIQGLNVCTKHVKPTQRNQKGSIMHFERPIHISNVKLYIEEAKTEK